MMEQEKDFSLLGYGEVMLRLSPLGDERLVQGNQLVKHAGGSELNVVSGVARLGLRTGLISKLPDSPIGRYVRGRIRAYGVSDDYVTEDLAEDARLGVYYYEGGSYPRKPQVVYDRQFSSFCSMSPEEVPEDIFTKTRVFHTCGISLALGDNPCLTAMELIRGFKEQGALISFDMNYRARLWSEEDARKTITALLPDVDILFVSEETSRRMMQMTGSLEEIQKRYAEEYGIGVVVSSQRSVNSPRSHNFTSMLYAAKEDTHFTEKPYENIEVVDRIGSGDAYVAGVLYGLLSESPYQQCVAIGNAMSALKNTMPGDLITTDMAEIESIMEEHQKGSKGEMNR